MSIQLNNISKSYKVRKDVKNVILNNISLEIDKGDLIAITGKSGAGKSTLLHIIGCLDTPTTGEYYIDGNNIKKYSQKRLANLRNKTFGFILQDFGLIPEQKVIDNVKIPLIFSNCSISKLKKTAQASLEKLHIEHLKDRYIEDLSGGEKQRVAIARALVNNPEYLLADEPTGALDLENSQFIINELLELNKEGKTVIIVTHDQTIADICKKRIGIQDGKLI